MLMRPVSPASATGQAAVADHDRAVRDTGTDAIWQRALRRLSGPGTGTTGKGPASRADSVDAVQKRYRRPRRRRDAHLGLIVDIYV